ncbi:DUF397 domain-containing protein [Nocardia huaxiensis]|uniref:DUF397 domain-containing protein n=1 Tax=Nocardia huaxiensis TaxID=2755382 RepID=A0A7D6ZJH4_9NOCA|nr:DUF397 domain-containing protein [Nocardia huaxiensis]QLY29223.1 DUF397 domain-containing protein [Nocardia huaxiensis]UFS97276.1 DUF397 domain-containing protein [Nocardia huaxiensis]
MSPEHADIAWFKSSYSQGGSECVEIAWLIGEAVGVRDSKNPAGPSLVFSSAQWSSFISGTAAGCFDVGSS